jgi:quercetin dioxygenase-like cupin family protein
MRLQSEAPLGFVLKVREEAFRPLTGHPLDEGFVCQLITPEVIGSEHISVSFARLLPGQYHARHRHPNGTEFYFFTQGSGLVHVGGEDVRATYGTLIFIPPNTSHSIKNDTDADVELVTICTPRRAVIGCEYDE